jgi:hypothetical protein
VTCPWGRALGLALLAACSTPPPLPEAPATSSNESRPPAAGDPTPKTSETNRVGPASAEAQPPVAFPARFERELDKPVTRVAVDRAPHLAALGAKSVFVQDKRGWHEHALPKAVADAPDLDLSLFYGRDYRVRIVGTHSGATGTQSVYLRAMPDGLRPAAYELGQLGNTKSGGLVAVLGTADPELVCRPGQLCLVKRTTGWSTLPAPAELTHGAIADGKAWVIVGQQLYRSDREWVAAAPLGSWQKAGALFAVGEQVFVLEPGPARVHELTNGAWRTFASPVGAPSCIWGASATSLWLAGSEGLAHFDGKAWRPVASAPKNVVSILGRNADEVWFAGAEGLHRLIVDGAPSHAPAAHTP